MKLNMKRYIIKFNEIIEIYHFRAKVFILNICIKLLILYNNKKIHMIFEYTGSSYYKTSQHITNRFKKLLINIMSIMDDP